jgi:hypothetical protein
MWDKQYQTFSECICKGLWTKDEKKAAASLNTTLDTFAQAAVQPCTELKSALELRKLTLQTLYKLDTCVYELCRAGALGRFVKIPEGLSVRIQNRFPINFECTNPPK